MKFRTVRLSWARSLVALSVSIAIVLSTHIFAFSSFAESATSATAPATSTDASQSEFRLVAASATTTPAGILLQWHTNSAADNLGFNVYRLKDGQRTRVNHEIIPGAAFASVAARPLMRAGYSYSWFDRSGSADSTYYIESVSLAGTTKTHEAISPGKSVSGFDQTPETLSAASANAPQSTDSFETYYPAAESGISSQFNTVGAIEDQWAIAAQSALKIGVKKDGWYRVTQAQMATAGFIPGDIRNLRLFIEAQEIAINTSQLTGPLGASDYIEFYGRGLDIPTTDTRVYYLVAGTTPGKRVVGQLQLDGSPPDPPAPVATPTPAPGSGGLPPATSPGPVLRNPIFQSAVDPNGFIFYIFSGARNNDARQGENVPMTNAPPDVALTYNSTAQPYQPDITPPLDAAPVAGDSPKVKAPEPAAGPDSNSKPRTSDDVAAKTSTTSAAKVKTRSLRLPVLTRRGKLRKRAHSRRRATTPPRQLKAERNHATMAPASVLTNFEYVAERKDRTVYYSSLLNGDEGNYFGQVIGSNAGSQTISVPNPDLTAAGPVKLEVAMQGVNQVFHQVTVLFNGTSLGMLQENNFFGQDHVVQTFDVPMSLLLSGTNTVTFSPTTCTPTCFDTTIVDYTRLTYPHQFRADAGSLRFSLRGTQSGGVDGFASSSTRLIDYTDPLNVKISRPSAQSSALGFAISVPTTDPPSKATRLLYAIPDGQFEPPASLLLNQPSNLNQGSLSPTITNGADFLIIAYKDYIPSFNANVSPINTSFVAQRQSQGMTAAAVDVEDVYDEFSYGVHGPQAIKDFISYASTSTRWATKPRYIIFAGDASIDPHNYQGVGNFDLVPTKLVDATYNETASDDWLADFNGDSIADIPVGRLPVRSVAEADLVVSKIVNYSPATVPQTALLIADDPGTPPFWDFESGNDNVQALLPPSMTVQRVNFRTEPSVTQTTTDIRDGINQGRAFVNYSGHGNVNIWSGSSFWGTANATALTNGMDKLTFVIVMDCLNGYFQDPGLLSLSEAFLKAPNGGAVAAFASSGLTTTFGQREMELELYRQLYGAQPISVGDAIKIAKGASSDFDVRATWIYFGDPSIKIR